MISRIWHGWTTLEKADLYEALLRKEIFVGIQGMDIKGYQGIQLLHRTIEDEEEFITIMRFENIEAVKAFVGENYHIAVVPEKAQQLLSRYDEHSQHYEVIVEDLPPSDN